MTRKDARDIYYDASGALSDVARHLSLAGVAVIWLFKIGEKTGGIRYGPLFLWSLALFILALGFDLFQYAYKSAAWGILHTIKERQKIDDFQAPGAINWPTLFFFWGKVAFIVIAYCMLIYAIAKQLIAQ
jgi:hypothetical protein